jgi:ribonuclease BN (tRNA processing enzyme)
VRRAAAAYEKGITAFGARVSELRTIFLTHLHADHTAGYPDLILTTWIMGRKWPLEVYGPKGIKASTSDATFRTRQSEAGRHSPH